MSLRVRRVFFSSWLQVCDSTKTAVRTRGTIVGFALLIATTPYTRPLAAQAASNPIQTTAQSTSIHGVVLNAISNQPVSRALVQVGQQSLLTGHDGKFEFADLTGTIVTVKVTKPGFYESQDPYQSAITFAQVGSPDEVQARVYPEALITGTLNSAGGDPLPQVLVQALRRVDDDPVGHWILGGQAYTNADGEFRLTMPGGEYVVETMYAQERSGSRRTILPTISPSAGSNGATGDAASTIRVPSGSEQHFELHPPLRSSHAVHIQVDSAGGQLAAQNGPQIQAHLQNGLVFSPPSHASEKQGEVVVTLPSGTYLVSASAGGRDDAGSYGETKVTVGDEDVSGVSIHLQPATELLIEASVDPATSSTAPNLSGTSLDRQLGIYLQKTDGGVNLGSDNVSPTSRRGGQLSFLLLPGRYRLRSTTYNAWFIESASAGGTDLLTQDLVVDGASSSLPLRLVASNETATVKGTVNLAGVAAACNVYFIADSPSTSPVITARSGQDGSFTRGLMPPGSYRVLASVNRAFFNLADPEVLAHFASYVKTVNVAAGETGGVELNAVPAAEWKP